MEAKNQQFHQELEAAVRKLGYGISSLTLQVHAGEVVSVLGQNFKQIRYKEGQNSEAVSACLAEIKKLWNKKKSGSLTFSFDFENGQIRKLEIQEGLIRKY
jgi:hypothetical protein